MAKTTKKDFELFEKEVQTWINVFGLKGWDIEIYHKTNINTSSASLWYNVPTRQIEYYLSKDFGKNKTDRAIICAGFHENIHHLLAKLIHVCTQRPNDEELINAEEHEIVRTLENTLFKYHEELKKHGRLPS